MFNLKLFLLILALSLVACGVNSSPSVTQTEKGAGGQESSRHAHDEHEGHEHGEGKHDPQEAKEGQILLSEAQVKLMGIKVEVVALHDFKASSKLPATIVGDPDREVKISSRVEGIVEKLNVRVGDYVTQGQVLAVISSPEISRLRSEFHTQETVTQLAQENLTRRLKLNHIGDTVRRPYEEALREVSQARLQINAAKASLDLYRSRLTRLQALLQDGIASQQQVEEARALYRESQARLEQAHLDFKVAQTHLTREQKLKDTGLLADNEAFQAQIDLRKSQQALKVASEVLLDLGADPASSSALLPLASPRTGIVTTRPKAEGEHVVVGDVIVTVLDPGKVWAWMDLPPDLIREIAVNSMVQVSVQGIEKQKFQGYLTFIAPEVDPDTKKIRARVELKNDDGQLRPNMFAQVVLPLGQSRKVLSLVREAVVTVENKQVVYIQEEPGHYQRRAVEVGERSGGQIEIVAGLQVGERVVTVGAPILQSEDLKASMGEAGHEH